MLLVPYTDLVLQFACEVRATRPPQGLCFLYPNGPKMFRRVVKLWIRSRLVSFDVTYDIQLIAPSKFILSPTVLFYVLMCHLRTMIEIECVECDVESALICRVGDK